LLDDLGDRRGYSHLKEEALDSIKWRNRFGRGCGPVVCLDRLLMMMTGCGPVVCLDRLLMNEVGEYAERLDVTFRCWIGD
jgi:hypothetical protein